MPRLDVAVLARQLDKHPVQIADERDRLTPGLRLRRRNRGRACRKRCCVRSGEVGDDEADLEPGTSCPFRSRLRETSSKAVMQGVCCCGEWLARRPRARFHGGERCDDERANIVAYIAHRIGQRRRVFVLMIVRVKGYEATHAEHHVEDGGGGL